MEPVLAGIVLVLCVLAFVRLLLGRSRQQRVDAMLRRAWFKLRRASFTLRVKVLTLWHWRRIRRDADQATRDAIARASGRAGRTPGTGADGEWKGNVYEPKSFKKPRKPH